MSKKSYSDWFNVYYGQNREDLILKSLFPNLKNGFYVDVGAQDPKIFSVTKIFYDMGWSGINIEPQAKFHKLLIDKRPRDINLKLLIGKSKGKSIFREYLDASGLSTASGSMKRNYESETEARLTEVTKRYIDYEVETRSLADIFEEYAGNRTISFLKIDVEGFEKEVIEGNDWNAYRPKVLCVEFNHTQNNLSKLIENNKYKEFLFDGLNKYYIDEAFYDNIAGGFNYAASALNKVPINIVPFNLFTRDIRRLVLNTKKQDEFIAKQDSFIKIQEQLIHDREMTINHYKKSILYRTYRGIKPKKEKRK